MPPSLGVDELLGYGDGDREKDVEIRCVRLPRTLEVPAGREAPQLLPYQMKSGAFSRAVQLMVAIRIDRKEFTRIPVAFDVRMFGEAVIAAKSIARSQTITPDMVTVERVVMAPGQNVMTDPDEVIGKVARRAIRANTLITQKMAEAPLLVSRNDLVMLFIRKGGLHITTKGRALERGRRGDVIRVRNPSSKRDVIGRVLDSRTVQVGF